MRNAENAFLQVNHQIKNILKKKGVLVLPSGEAWEKFKWTREYFVKRPKEGYFIWVKRQIDFSLLTCVTLASPRIFQNLKNLLVIEKGIKAKAVTTCNAVKNDLCGRHKAQGTLLLKRGAHLEYNHFHQWGGKDIVNPDYQFILKENSGLIYNYKNLFPPKSLNLKTVVFTHKNSSANLNFIINGKHTKVNLEDIINLEEKNSQGVLRLRLVAKKNSEIRAKSSIFARGAGKGHLDCQGLLVDENSEISLIPELICQNKKAQITHEASIGKIAQEQLNYLRMKGLNEREAIDLIVNGFLKI